MKLVAHNFKADISRIQMSCNMLLSVLICSGQLRSKQRYRCFYKCELCLVSKNPLWLILYNLWKPYAVTLWTPCTYQNLPRLYTSSAECIIKIGLSLPTTSAYDSVFFSDYASAVQNCCFAHAVSYCEYSQSFWIRFLSGSSRPLAYRLICNDKVRHLRLHAYAYFQIFRL